MSKSLVGSVVKRAWDASGFLLGAYAVWKHLQSAKEARDDLYNALPADAQAKWIGIFGAPQAAVQTPGMPVVQTHSPAAGSSQLEKVKAGV